MIKTFFRILGTSIVVLLAVAAAGCSSNDSAAQADIPPEVTKLRIGISQCNLDEPWRVQMIEDAKKAAAAHSDVELIVKDAQDDVQLQKTQVAELLASGVKVLVISPQESVALTDPVAQAYERGVPVIVLDRPVLGDRFTCFLGADNEKIGEAAGRWLAKRLDGKGRIVELEGLMNSPIAQQRHKGFRAALKDPGFRVIVDVDTLWRKSNAKREMLSAMEHIEDIDAVFAQSDALALGAYEAAKQLGREKDIVFVGIDALPGEGISYVRDGILDASFEYPTGGEEAVDVALKALAGEQVPKRITLGTRVYTKENLDRGGDPID